MAASAKLLAQVRTGLAKSAGVTEVKMFGGVCFMLRGHMLCGVETERFMFRVGPANEAKALSLAGASPMDFTGRPLRGFVYVEAGRRLAPFLTLALNYVSALPAKKKNPKKRKPRPRARKAGRA
ncbi:MAG: TfoX/Sxy family protein [Archangium sp.]|nr:TfoX/Sxy family protein [Archangium sp.]